MITVFAQSGRNGTKIHQMDRDGDYSRGTADVEPYAWASSPSAAQAVPSQPSTWEPVAKQAPRHAISGQEGHLSTS